MNKLIEKVQVNVPFRLLHASYLPLFLVSHLNPEIGVDALALDRFGPKDLQPVAEALHRNGARMTLHAPFMDLSAGSPDPQIRTLTRRRLAQFLEWVPIFKPVTVVCHSGYDAKRYAFCKDDWIARSAEIWSWFGESIRDQGGRLMLENVYEHHPDEILMLLERLEEGLAGFCLDIGHQSAFSRSPLETWLKSLAPRLGQLHLHDNSGQGDDHRAIGQGRIDFEAFFRRLIQYRATPPVVTLEPHQEEDLWPSLRALEALWPWP
jgi:sugar phosphate isomerase/epimerase